MLGEPNDGTRLGNVQQNFQNLKGGHRKSGSKDVQVPDEARCSRDSEKKLIESLPFRIAIMLAIALVLEIFLFNYQHWSTLGNKDPISLITKSVTIKGPEDKIVIDDLDSELNNLSFEFSQSIGNQLVFCHVRIADEGYSDLYELPEIEMSGIVKESLTSAIHPYGKVKSIEISFPESSEQGRSYSQTDYQVDRAKNPMPITLESLTANVVVPIGFNVIRFLLAFLIMLLVYAFRPKSSLYQTMAFEGSRSFVARCALIACALLASIVILFAHQGVVQLSSAHYNSDAWDGESLVNSSVSAQDRIYGATDEYHSLARSFAKGRLDLEQTPPSWLETIENPYDSALRRHAAEASGEQAKMDAAYHDGRYYVYFGVLPVLLLYLPFYMATGLDFPNSMAVLIFTLAFIVGLYLTVRLVIRERYRTCSLGVFLLAESGVLLTSGAIWLLNSPNFYNVPISCGLCMAVWGLHFWARGVLRKRCAFIALGSTFAALTAASRPTLLAICILLPFVIYLFVKDGTHAAKSAEHAKMSTIAAKSSLIKACLAVFVPLAIVAGALMAYNAARFGSPFDFGANYNLTGNDMTRRGFVLSRFFEGIFAYFFQAPAIEPAFPFMYPAGTSSGYIGYTSREIITGGVFAIFPFLWVLVSAPFLDMARRRKAIIGALCLIALVICLFDMQASGITGRYCEDFCFLLALAAGLALLELVGGAGVQSRLRVGSVAVLVFATALFVLVMLLFGLGTNWFAGYSSPTVWELVRQTFQFWS